MARWSPVLSELLSHDQTHPDFYPLLQSRVDVPDEYSLILRTAGLYPFIALPVAVVTENSREKIRKRFEADLKNLPVDGSLRAFMPGKGRSLGGGRGFRRSSKNRKIIL